MESLARSPTQTPKRTMIEHLRTASVSASAAHTAAGKATATDKLFLITEPVDMRLGIDGLSAAIQTRLATSPCAGGIYIFMNARGNRLKLLLWDGTGVWLALRRLHKGRFIFSRAGAGAVQSNGNGWQPEWIGNGYQLARTITRTGAWGERLGAISADKSGDKIEAATGKQ
jgi:transposase